MSKYAFNLRVYYEDTDAAGVVYYANYLKFLERARTQILEINGLNNIYIKNFFEIYFVVTSCNISYIKPAKLDDLLTVSSFVVNKTKLRIMLDQSIYNKKKLIISSKVELVSVNLIGKPVRMPKKIFDIF